MTRRLLLAQGSPAKKSIDTNLEYAWRAELEPALRAGSYPCTE
jgi:hypothetical protein